MRTYLGAVRSFAAWSGKPGLPADLAGAVERWLEDAAGAWSAATARQRRQALAAFLRWVSPGAPAPAAPSARTATSTPLRTAIPDLTTLTRAIGGRSAVRDRALVALVAGCGLSCAAVARLRVVDVDPEGGVLAVRRGARRRAVAVPPEVLTAVRSHWRSLAGRGLRGEVSAWPGRQGPLGEDGVRRVVQRRLREVGVDGGVVALRRTHLRVPPSLTAAVAEQPRPATAPVAPRREEGLVLVCGPEPEAGRLAATIRVLGQSPVVAGSIVVGLEIFRARPARFARVLLWGDGPEVAAAAAECERIAPGVAQLLA